MKHLILSLSILATGLSTLTSSGASAASQNYAPQFLTADGGAYKRTTEAPYDMLPAYQGPNGLIWSRMMSSGTDFKTATEICNSANYDDVDETRFVRLPTKYELLALRESMSSTPDLRSQGEIESGSFTSYNRSYDRMRPAFPALFSLQIADSNAIWSSSAKPATKDQPESAFVMDTDGGTISLRPTSQSNLKVICVMGTR